MGSDSGAAKMGAITTKSMGVHIVGMFFFKADTNQVKEILNLLIYNLTGKEFASYAVITPEKANLPGDVLRTIPLVTIKNSATGSEPKDFWEQVADAIGGAITSAVNFVYNAIVALGNFIAHAAEVIAQAAMQVFNVVANAVKAAVEVIVDVLSAVVEWIKEMAARALNAITNGIKDAMQGLIDIFSAIGASIYNAIFNGEMDNTVFKLSDGKV